VTVSGVIWIFVFTLGLVSDLARYLTQGVLIWSVGNTLLSGVWTEWVWYWKLVSVVGVWEARMLHGILWGF